MTRYNRSTLVGCGTYANVYRVSDEEVVKHIPSSTTTHVPSSCIWDIVIPTTLRHRNIVKVTGVVMGEDGVHIGMPMYTPVEKVSITMMYKLIHALGYLHDNDVIHRDIKRENIMMDGEEPIIIDFSISRIGILPTMSTVVYTGLHRMPSIAGGKYSFDADIYAMGMTFFFLITGSSMLSSMTLPSMVSVCERHGRIGMVVSRLLRCESIPSILLDDVFSGMGEPTHSPPVYRGKVDVPLSQLIRLDDISKRYTDLPTGTVELARSILSQSDSPGVNVKSILAIAISILEDMYVFDVRTKVLDLVVRNLMIEV